MLWTPPTEHRGVKGALALKKKMILPFAVLATVPFIMVLGNSMLIPVFPLMERELGLSQFQVGLLITAFSIPAGVVIPFAGALSDYIGRKRVMFPALLLYGLGGLGAGSAAWLLADPFPWMLAGRVLQGIGAGGTYQIALALTGDLFQSDERTKAVGILEAANGLGKVISPVAGAALGLLVWFAPFFAYGLLAIPIAFAVWFVVREPEGRRQPQSVGDYLNSLKTIFRDRGVPLSIAYLSGAVGLFLLFGLLSFISDELELQHSITGVMKGLVLAIPVTVMTVTAYGSGLFLQKRMHWLKPSVIAGLALTGAGMFGLAFWPGLVPLLLLSSVMGLGIGLMLPALNTLITSSTAAEERGLITALYGTVRFFGVALGPPAFGLVQGVGRLPMFLGGAAFAAAGLVLVIFFLRAEELMVERPDAEDGKTTRAPGQEAKAEDASSRKSVVESFSPDEPRRSHRHVSLHDDGRS